MTRRRTGAWTVSKYSNASLVKSPWNPCNTRWFPIFARIYVCLFIYLCLLKTIETWNLVHILLWTIYLKPFFQKSGPDGRNPRKTAVPRGFLISLFFLGTPLIWDGHWLDQRRTVSAESDACILGQCYTVKPASNSVELYTHGQLSKLCF